MAIEEALRRVRNACSDYAFEPIAVFKRDGDHPWPLVASNEAELEQALASGGHFLPLPKEPAALANIVEVAVVDHLMKGLSAPDVAELTRGTERGYPDLEAKIGGEYYAIDIKVARRKVGARGKALGRTDSRITLYTGNTFFLYPTFKWPGTFRPFSSYAGHIDVICLYTLDAETPTRVKDFELLVTEPWRIASKHRSSTTREYLGAVQEIDRLRSQSGDFATQEQFYTYWRNHNWKIGKSVQKLLQRIAPTA